MILPDDKNFKTPSFYLSKFLSIIFFKFSSAKNSVKLTKKYGKCLPNGSEDLGMDNVYKNMRFISRIVCENVNKRCKFEILF